MPTDPTPGRDRETGRRTGARAGVALLAVLPVLLALVGYYRPLLRGRPVVRPGSDVAFSAYQLTRAGELGGRWWRIADDERLAVPYPTEVAKNPALYEGVDLMLLAAAAVPFVRVGPAPLYDLAACAVLVTNGWAAGWVVRRRTGSWLWAAVAVSLLTLNFPTAWRLAGGHLHLFKYAWTLGAVAAFGGYLDRPGAKRGVWLGLAVAGALQGSFYMGFLLGLGLGVWWLGAALAGRLDRRHVVGAVAAGLAFAPAAALLTFPVWTASRSALLADGFFQRSQRDLWLFGSDPWQFFVPPDAPAAARYVAGVGHKPLLLHFEGWTFPGYSVLLAVGLYLAARARGWRPGGEGWRSVDLWLGLSAVYVGLSLSGGPSFFLFGWFPGFRCYGRAGLLALALGCVAAPVIAQALIGSLRSPRVRAAASAAFVVLAASDGYRAVRHVEAGDPAYCGPPAWSSWLASQPAGVNLAAFAPLREHPSYAYGVRGLLARPGPGHTVLNGADFTLLEGDLALLGGTYERMNPACLRFLASIGYEALAFHAEYLAANPWIDADPGLTRVETRAGWSIYRTKPGLRRFPTVTPAQLLAARPRGEAPARVPPGCWVTGSLGGGEGVVTADGSRTFLTWEDARGRRAEPPRRALFQHVFGDDLPAFTVRSPRVPGDYRLVVLDDRGRRLGELPYAVDPAVRPSTDPGPGRRADVSLSAARVGEGVPGLLRVAVQNRSPYYLPAQADRRGVAPSARPHPGIGDPPPGSLRLRAVVRGDGPDREVRFRLPRDLPRGDRIEFALPADRLPGPGAATFAEVAPTFSFGDERLVPAPIADVRIGRLSVRDRATRSR